MIDGDVVARKLLSLSESLANLRRPECRDAARLRADVDVAHHVIAAEAWTPPPTARAAFLSLAAHGRLDGELAQRLGSAVGLRNLLVRDYADVDLARLAAVVANDLADLEAFARAAATWIQRRVTSSC